MITFTVGEVTLIDKIFQIIWLDRLSTLTEYYMNPTGILGQPEKDSIPPWLDQNSIMEVNFIIGT